VAGQLKAQARGTYNMLVRVFNDGAKTFWKNADFSPEAIAECLNTDGKELFQLHAKIGELLAAVKPEAIAEGAAAVGKFSYTEDGKIVVETTPPTT
jgi:hypothetical protein